MLFCTVPMIYSAQLVSEILSDSLATSGVSSRGAGGPIHVDNEAPDIHTQHEAEAITQFFISSQTHCTGSPA
jgi:hypothetical protein